jgi:hypothetical protein
MSQTTPSKLDRLMAAVCERCVICRRARRTQRGLAFGFVRGVEDGVCPFCRAYEKVHGRKSHQPPAAKASEA